jgi:GDPmannose 4,6-dehydratase
MRVSLITGASGQDGVLLKSDLEGSGREVVEVTQRWTRSRVYDGPFSYRDPGQLTELLNATRPHEIYHLACPSALSETLDFQRNVFLLSVDVPLTILRWIFEVSPMTRFFFASSSEIFGDPCASPQHELTPPSPQHPYAVAKLAGQQLVDYFRLTKGLHASSGILYNHESSLRRKDFVSRRITSGVANIASGLAPKLSLGNLQARRDWSHASDFTRGFRLCVEAKEPGNFIFASGTAHSVQDFCDVAFKSVGLLAEDHLVPDTGAFRPDFSNPRMGDPSKAWNLLGWRPQFQFEEWISEMVRYDISLVSRKGDAVMTDCTQKSL